MTCSKCAECCKWLAFTVTMPINEVYSLLRQDVLVFTIPTIDDDTKRYYEYRPTKVVRQEDKTYLLVDNKEKILNKIEPIGRNKYRIVIRSVCTKLDGNLCSIWDARPSACDKTKNTTKLWHPLGCTDKEEK